MDKEFLIREYVELGKSTKALAREFGVNAGLVSYYLRKYEIKARPASVNPDFDFDTLIADGVLFDLYVTQQLSVKQVALHFGCSNGPVLRALKLLGIKTRSKHVNIRPGNIGKDFTGENNPRWRGGKSKCCVCGKQLTYRRASAKCLACFREYLSTKERATPDQCKTDESKLWRRRIEFKNWRSEVFKRDGYMCQVCGKNTRDLHPHHLDAFSAYPEKRFVTDNGVTLCSPHHKEFHKLFGYGGNTASQFSEYLSITKDTVEVTG
jgi:5-methylcytosine-specific restriction endonuclease McrA